MADYINPSYNPTNAGTLAGVMDVVLNTFKEQLDDMLPAKVIACDRFKAQVQPLIDIVTTSDERIARAQIASVPILQLSGGGYVLSFPVQAGDLGFIKSNDRDISMFKQTMAQCEPNTARKHDFADAVFIPAKINNFTLASADSGNVVLQAVDGSVRFSMGDGHTCITDQSSYNQSANAILDVQSVTKAFKFPVMTNAQKIAIPSPKIGFCVFDSTHNGLSVYTTSGWS